MTSAGARVPSSSNAAGIYMVNSTDSATSGNNGDVKNKIKTHDATPPVLRAKRPKIEMKEEDAIGPVVFSEEQHRRFLRFFPKCILEWTVPILYIDSFVSETVNRWIQ